MGKPTGFLEFARTNNKAIAPLERISHFNEFHPPLSLDDRQKQGARCMNCGVPFCQSGAILDNMATGCPLHNLIPEWNDEIYNANWQHALARLLKTNNFPEFTGRVCPALCEAACTCGLNSAPVTVKENELAIIEQGFANGWIAPHPPQTKSGKKVAVVGSRPAGLACADQLNHRGHEVTVFERDDRAGGLLMYGIPNMKLEKEIITRRIDLMTAEGVTFRTNSDIGRNIEPKEILANFDAVVLCCGAKEPKDLTAENREAEGIYFAVDYLSGVTKELLGDKLPENAQLNAKDKNIIIVGGGDTGNDCVATAIRQRAKSIVQLERWPKPPTERAADNAWPKWPRVLKTDYGQEEAIALYGHDPRLFQTTIKRLITDENNHLTAAETVRLEPYIDPVNGARDMKEIPGSEETLPCEMILIAAGFKGANDYVAQAFGLDSTARHTVATAPNGYQTANPQIFAAGDMRRGQSLVVWAIAEGRECAKEVDRYLMGYTNMV